MRTCKRCGEAQPDDAVLWPDGTPGGDGQELCQACWEAEVDRMWWDALNRFSPALAIYGREGYQAGAGEEG